MALSSETRRTIPQRVGRELSRFQRRWSRWWQRRPSPPREPRVPFGRDDLELHTLLCSADVPMALWSLRSFVASSGLLPRVVIHDDGSLTASDRRRLHAHFEGLVVRHDVDATAEMEAALGPWPACRRMRRRRDFYCARKLLDILFCARADCVLYVDSDILFFRPPVELLEHLRSGRPCFWSDYQSAYGASAGEIEHQLGVSIEPCVNAGLLCIPVASYRERMDQIERYLACAEVHWADAPVNRHEQTAHAIVMTALGAARLPAAYALTGTIDEETTSFHFVNDGRERTQFWRAGVPRVRRTLLPELPRVIRG